MKIQIHEANPGSVVAIGDADQLEDLWMIADDERPDSVQGMCLADGELRDFPPTLEVEPVNVPFTLDPNTYVSYL